MAYANAFDASDMFVKPKIHLCTDVIIFSFSGWQTLSGRCFSATRVVGPPRGVLPGLRSALLQEGFHVPLVGWCVVLYVMVGGTGLWGAGHTHVFVSPPPTIHSTRVYVRARVHACTCVCLIIQVRRFPLHVWGEASRKGLINRDVYLASGPACQLWAVFSSVCLPLCNYMELVSVP